MPEHAPDQPAKVLLVVSLSVTCVLGGNIEEQPVVEPDVQLIPAGLLVTVPVPVPAVDTVTANPAPKLALTVVAPVSVTVHVAPVPEQPPPLHPAKDSPPVGVSVSVTCVFGGKLAEQVVGQLIPEGPVTIPVPVVATVRASPATNVAVTLVAAVMVTTQVVPEQPPVHPLKKYPLAGVAVRVTCVFCAKLAEQVEEGQLIPEGLLVMVPVFAEGAVTVN